jgi:hypothetical protein
MKWGILRGSAAEADWSIYKSRPGFEHLLLPACRERVVSRKMMDMAQTTGPLAALPSPLPTSVARRPTTAA